MTRINLEVAECCVVVVAGGGEKRHDGEELLSGKAMRAVNSNGRSETRDSIILVNLILGGVSLH